MELILGKIKVDLLTGNSGVFWGENTLRGWHTYAKANAVMGRISGDRNFISSKINYLDDQDVIDYFIRKRGRKKAGDITET